MRENIAILQASIPTDLEKSIESILNIMPTQATVKKFANGETYINILGDMRNKDVYIMPTTGNNVNDNMMEVFLKADASRRMGAHKIIAVLPNFPYGRQERKSEVGEPVSAKLNLSLLNASGVDEIITVDMHAPALHGFARQLRLTEVSSLTIMSEYLKKFGKDIVIVSPDLGGVKRADKLANLLGCDKAVVYKHRTAHNEAKAEQLLGNVHGKVCVIYDDLIDTAGTICEASKMLKANGAEKVYVCASHGLFNGKALERIEESPIEAVVVTNSETLPNSSKIKQIDLGESIVNTILAISC